jgi:hypothetical protein
MPNPGEMPGAPGRVDGQVDAFVAVFAVAVVAAAAGEGVALDTASVSDAVPTRAAIEDRNAIRRADIPVCLATVSTHSAWRRFDVYAWWIALAIENLLTSTYYVMIRRDIV